MKGLSLALVPLRGQNEFERQRNSGTQFSISDDHSRHFYMGVLSSRENNFSGEPMPKAEVNLVDTKRHTISCDNGAQ